ncbi:MAG: CoA-binding protein [Alphaproteobacteria bacterium]
MNHETYSDTYLRDILSDVRTVAVVGASPRPHRASHRVMHYLQRQGYRAIPVNPNAAGTTILGEACHASLADLPRAGIGPIDMVDIFRRSEAAGAVVDEAIALGTETLGVKAIWMQLGVVDLAAASRAEASGIKVVMNRCPAIEIPRLGIARKASS